MINKVKPKGVKISWILNGPILDGLHGHKSIEASINIHISRIIPSSIMANEHF